MRVLVVSDSHGMIGRLGSILMAAEAEGPLDAIIHLGDGYSDLDEFSGDGLPPRYQVAGNCDLGRDGGQEIISLSGARLLLTHGHRYQVRQGVENLLGEARLEKVQAALYGHTHVQKCQWAGGLLLLNPGAAMDGRYAILRISRLGAVEAQLH